MDLLGGWVIRYVSSWPRRWPIWLVISSELDRVDEAKAASRRGRRARAGRVGGGGPGFGARNGQSRYASDHMDTAPPTVSFAATTASTAATKIVDLAALQAERQRDLAVWLKFARPQARRLEHERMEQARIDAERREAERDAAERAAAEKVAAERAGAAEAGASRD